MKNYETVTNEENELTKNILRLSNYVLGGFNRWENNEGLYAKVVYHKECFPNFTIKIMDGDTINNATLQGTIAFLLKNKMYPDVTDYEHFYTAEILP